MKTSFSFCIVALLLLAAVLGGEARGRPYRNNPTVHFHDGNLDDVHAIGQLLYERSVVVGGFCACGTGFASAADGVETTLRVLETVASLAEADGDQPFADYVRGIPVAQGSDVPLSSSVNLESAILNVIAPPIRDLTRELWFTRDPFFPSVGSLVKSELSCTELMMSLTASDDDDDNHHGDDDDDDHRRGYGRGRGSRINVLVTGTSTDLAIALQEEPSLANKIKSTWVMGGAINAPGNLFSFPDNTLAEFNIYTDPLAAEIVLRALTVTMVTLDATNDVQITREFVAQLASVADRSLFTQWFFTVLSIVEGAFTTEVFYNDGHGLGGGYFRWDQLASQAMIDGRCTSMSLLPLSVDLTEGPLNPSGNLRKDYSIRKQEIICEGIDPVESDAEYFDWVVDAGVLPPSAKRSESTFSVEEAVEQVKAAFASTA